jgi:hypothetical protein
MRRISLGNRLSFDSAQDEFKGKIDNIILAGEQGVSEASPGVSAVQASECLASMVEFLKTRRCFLLVDDVNALFAKDTEYRDPRGNPIATASMAVLGAIQDLAISANTTLVAAINASDPQIPRFVPEHVVPLFTDLVRVEPMQSQESESLLRYYASKGHVRRSLTRHWCDKMRFCSGGNPSLVLNACNYDAVFHPE